jgi:hypothetical protein
VFGKAVRFALKEAVPGAVVVSRVLFGASEAGDDYETTLRKVVNVVNIFAFYLNTAVFFAVRDNLFSNLFEFLSPKLFIFTIFREKLHCFFN